MNRDVKKLIDSAVLRIIENTSGEPKLNKLKYIHSRKIHFIPENYRVFGGLLQSMNIQFGNFIETLMTVLVENDGAYEVIRKYSGKKSNCFELSGKSDSMIDEYVTKCQYGDVNIDEEFPKLLKKLAEDKDEKTYVFKHDIDLLFRDKKTNKIYYLEIKYNDDHDTGKFVDINRKFIKTYAYLARELGIKTSDELVPIIFFFTNKKMKGNIYVPEHTNIKRGKEFFDEFLSVGYDEVDGYMSGLSEDKEIIEMFDGLYKRVMKL